MLGSNINATDAEVVSDLQILPCTSHPASHCQFHSNTASTNGGSLWLESYSIGSFTRCQVFFGKITSVLFLIYAHALKFTGSNATLFGGAVHAQDVPLVNMNRCILKGNRALNGGGISAVNTDQIIVSNKSLFADNTGQDFAALALSASLSFVMPGYWWWHADYS